ncbi:DUF4138 domain-containing protein [uncultured Algoriphagus sp.]|uniref:DUF4138 domain-containing protein n=1 Tax=uncultured Algoriphagus sp. TaxID=417365 RepID=UPI0025833F0F|nr:DUF4138 domain-containing protein [uncultured Algoriphagus sp.]
MQKVKLIVGFLGLIWSSVLYAQSPELEVAWDKTTVLIFDAPIQSIDRGSQWLLGQKDAEAVNLLKLKAGSKDMPNTNLHVLTSDGRIHEFEVSYSEDPMNTTWDFRKKKELGSELKSPLGMNFTEFEGVAKNLASLESKSIKRQFRYEIFFWIKGIYYQDGLLFFDLMLHNTSRIPFQPIGPEVRIVDSRSSKRSTSREVDLEPAFSLVSGLNEKVGVESGQELKSMVLAYPVFTIANQKRLVFRLREARGDRELQLSLKGKDLLQAKSLPLFIDTH